MARAWIVDLWVKDATIIDADGQAFKVVASPAQLKTIKSLPEQFRSSRYKRGKRWKVVWHEAGNQRSKLFETKRDAEALRAELEDDIRSGRYIDPSYSDKPFSELAEVWLKSKGKIKDSTYRRYKRDLDTYVLPKWKNIRVGSVSREQIDAWVQELRQGTAPRSTSTSKHVNDSKMTQKGLSAASIDGIARVAFGAPLRYAVSNSWIGRNPMQDVELPKDEVEKTGLPSLTYLDIENLADLAYAYARHVPDRALVHILAYMGLRIGEATALRVSDLDANRNRLKVNRTWTVTRDGKRKVGPTKTRQTRWVPVPRFLIKELASLADAREPDEYLLVTKQGNPIDGGNWYNRVWVKIRENSPAKKLTVHDLRHVAATLAIAANGDVKLVQRMLGHKDASETLNTYAELWPDKVGEVISLVEARREKALKQLKN